MTNVLTNYPALRAGIYAVVAGALGVAAVFGFVTQDQVDSVLANVGLGLGALASVIALFNLSGKKDAALQGADAVPAQSPPAIDLDALADLVSHRIDVRMPSVQQVMAAGQQAFADASAHESVADLRRRAEQELGHRFGG